MKSLATAGQRLVLLVPADEEQQGQPEALEPQGQAEAHSVSKSKGRPPQKGSANDHLGREEKKEEGMPAASICRPDGRVAERGPQAKVSNPSSIIGPVNVHFSSLKSGLPMCGPTPEPRMRSNLNPAAEEFVPRPPGWFDQGLACGQFLLHQMCHFLPTLPQQVGCSGVQPWLCTPCLALPSG